MEYLAGGTLADVLESGGPLPPADVAWIGRRLGDALDHAHKAGVIHRDVKPANVLLGNGDLQLADFGIAKLADATQTTGAGVTATLLFAAPEVLEGRPASVASDLYSLGATLYALAVGRPPHTELDDETHRAALVRAMSGREPDLSMLDDAPVQFRELLGSLLAPEAKDRPPSAAAVRDSFAALCGENVEHRALVEALSQMPPVEAPPTKPQWEAETDQSETVARSPRVVVGSGEPQTDATSARAAARLRRKRVLASLSFLAACLAGGGGILAMTNGSGGSDGELKTAAVAVDGTQQVRTSSNDVDDQTGSPDTSTASDTIPDATQSASTAGSLPGAGNQAASSSTTRSTVGTSGTGTAVATSTTRTTSPAAPLPAPAPPAVGPTTTSTTIAPPAAKPRTATITSSQPESHDFILGISTSQCAIITWSVVGVAGPYADSTCSTSHALSPRTSVTLTPSTTYTIQASISWPDGSKTSETWSVKTTAPQTQLTVSISPSRSGSTATVVGSSNVCTTAGGWFSTTDGGRLDIADHTGSLGSGAGPCKTSHSFVFEIDPARPYRVSLTFTSADGVHQSSNVDF